MKAVATEIYALPAYEAAPLLGVDEDKFSCQFCYCPLYLKENCGGGFVMLPGGIKDCSNCLLPHTNYDHIMNRLIADSRPQ